jgi:hypothetical protein
MAALRTQYLDVKDACICLSSKVVPKYDVLGSRFQFKVRATPNSALLQAQGTNVTPVRGRLCFADCRVATAWNGLILPPDPPLAAYFLN